MIIALFVVVVVVVVVVIIINWHAYLSDSYNQLTSNLAIHSYTRRYVDYFMALSLLNHKCIDTYHI